MSSNELTLCEKNGHQAEVDEECGCVRCAVCGLTAAAIMQSEMQAAGAFDSHELGEDWDFLLGEDERYVDPDLGLQC